MGGRRARSVSEIVGSGVTARGFTRALDAGDPEALAANSAKMIAKSDRITDIFYYVSKLASVVKDVIETGKALPYDERESIARREWARIKREENLPDDPIATQAIVSAVTKALGRAGK